MSDTTQKSAQAGQSVPEVQIQLPIHFIKSTQFRVIHANGVWFGGDMQQNLHLTFFNERNPIPRKLVLNVNSKGNILGEDMTKRDTKEGVVREMEMDVVLSFQAAMELHKSLNIER
ncbi:MAG: hypothetical protein ABSH48_24100 [Verrucomicrobiota bacterium]|jgi:hypothetical protein